MTIRALLLIKCFRPDRLLQATAIFATSSFGKDLTAESTVDLGAVVHDEVLPTTPVAMVSVTGFDASFKVENLVQTYGIKCHSVAMGSQEGFALAEQAIAVAARQGTWVLLKNVHLAPSWLGQLEKRVQNANPNKAFRLFLTMEANPVVPVNILRQSRIIMNEPPPGIRANLLDSLKNIPNTRLAQGPTEKVRLYFLLAWFHAVIQERLRYVPLGWSKAYDFNDSDMDSAFKTIDQWLQPVAKGRANIDPALIPWDAVKTLVKQSVYGGRIDSDFDQRVLDAFVDTLFTPKAYDMEFELVPSHSSTGTTVTAPEGTKIEHFLDWVSLLPERESPSWLSLPPTAERVIAISQGLHYFVWSTWRLNLPAGIELLGKLRKMRTLQDDEDDNGATGRTSSSPSQQPAWMRTLVGSCKEWLSLVPQVRRLIVLVSTKLIWPKGLTSLPKQSHDGHDPLYRFFIREIAVGRKLLRQVRKDLEDVGLACQGVLKQTNHLRQLMSDLTKGTSILIVFLCVS